MPNSSGPMACPVDGATLVMSERSGIEIDYCPTCRGVWLDRGELDKIIERNSADMAAAAPRQQQQSYQQHQGQHGNGHKPYKRRKTFLDELFD
jgi:Zn-finger nucleic acid-binding protein